MSSRVALKYVRRESYSTRSGPTAGGQRSRGGQDAHSWLGGTVGSPPTVTRWHVEIALDVVAGEAPSDWDERTATRFHLGIYSEEWSIYFCHQGRASSIRVTDVPFVHRKDDFALLPSVGALQNVGSLIRSLEQLHSIEFSREHARIQTNLAHIEPAVRRWVSSL